MAKRKAKHDWLRPVFSRRMVERARQKAQAVDIYLDERAAAGDSALLRRLVEIGIEAVDARMKELRSVPVIEALLRGPSRDSVAAAMRFAAELARDGHGSEAIRIRNAITSAREERDRLWHHSEVGQLEELLAGVPEDQHIMRHQIEHRLKMARDRVEQLGLQHLDRACRSGERAIAAAQRMSNACGATTNTITDTAPDQEES